MKHECRIDVLLDTCFNTRYKDTTPCSHSTSSCRPMHVLSERNARIHLDPFIPILEHVFVASGAHTCIPYSARCEMFITHDFSEVAFIREEHRDEEMFKDGSVVVLHAKIEKPFRRSVGDPVLRSVTDTCELLDLLGRIRCCVDLNSAVNDFEVRKSCTFFGLTIKTFVRLIQILLKSLI